MLTLALLSIVPALAAEPAPPEVALNGFVMRPTFEIAEKKSPAGGMAFVVDHEERRFAISAYQLLGAPSGMATVPAADVATSVTKIALSELASQQWLANTGVPLVIAAEVVGSTASKDVIVAPIEVSKDRTAALTMGDRATLKPGALAAEDPKKGDPVWLVSPLANAADAGFIHAGTIAEINGDFIFYDVANRELDLAGTSGAPLVDAGGKVVGMQVGVIRFEDGALAGSAVPLAAIKARIAEGLGNATP
ncbi:MAG: hypothetical protein KC912_06765 [Proteobacteria bacterium]|nr:hypothetical protein [Pseudomonadota bacterium]